MNAVRLLVIDDHPMFRRGLVTLLAGNSRFEVVGESGSGREGVEMARRLHPDLVLLDWHMPRLSGMQVLDEIRQLELACRVVVFTASLDRSELLQALALGCNGYALKDMEPSRLQAYLLQCCEGTVVLKDQMVALLAQPQPTPPTSAAGLAAPLHQIELTTREAQTLALIARGLSNKLVARELGISDGTVKIYVKNLLRKLRLRSRLDLAAWFHQSS